MLKKAQLLAHFQTPGQCAEPVVQKPVPTPFSVINSLADLSKIISEKEWKKQRLNSSDMDIMTKAFKAVSFFYFARLTTTES